MYFDITSLPAESAFSDNLYVSDPKVLENLLGAKAEGQLWALGLSTKLEYNTEFNGVITPSDIYSINTGAGVGAGASGEINTAGGAAYGTSSWMQIARGELGVKEFNNGSNPRINEYHNTTSSRGDGDDVAWCSSFVNWVMIQAGYRGTNSAGSRSWANWGTAVAPGTIGSIVVLANAGGSRKGHVGFCIGYVPGKYVHLLGGNQSNAVTDTSKDKRRIVGWRWPTQGDRR